MKHTNQPIPEKEFAARINLNRTVVAQLRAELLEKEVDWVAEGNGRIMLLPSGVKKMAGALSGPGEATDGGVEAALAIEEAKPEPEIFFVSKLVTNPRVLLATRDKARKEKPVTVRVRNSQLYSVGMQIAAVPSNGSLVYNVHGRPPRSRSQRIAPGAR
tara:strand:- start:8809 stop:9285 length:477 start_codon:yes stop_codon:yes gene_type:complete